MNVNQLSLLSSADQKWGLIEEWQEFLITHNDT